MKLGQLLLHRRVIDRSQLREALRRQRDSGRPLGEVLLAMGIVSRTDIVSALLSQPQGSVNAETLARVRPRTWSMLPLELCRRHRCVPVVHRSGFTVVAMEDPTDRRAVAAVEEALDGPVLTVAAASQAVTAALARQERAMSGPPSVANQDR